MRAALIFGFSVAFSASAFAQAAAQTNAPAVPAVIVPVQASAPPPAAPSVQAAILSGSDVATYRQAFAAARAGQTARMHNLLAKVSDSTLEGYVQAVALMSAKRPTREALVEWLGHYRELSVADRIYRMAVARSTKKVRKGRKTITVAVVTNIPAPASVGRRSGGYEDAALPEPAPRSEAARGLLPQILADIKAGTPDTALGRLDALQTNAALPPEDVAALSHRIALSYLAEGQDAQAFQLTAGLSAPSAPQLDWDAGFSAYRLGRYADAVTHLEHLAQNSAVPASLRAQAAFWAARSYMQMGDPQKVITLLANAAREQPTFYGLIAERMLGMDTRTGFTDAVLSQADFTALMGNAPARRAVALHQVGEDDFTGPELNRAFVENDERLDPAMSALARETGVTNVELRASEKSVSHGLLLTGLFPVPPYAPQDGYHVDSSLVLAFARIESRFQQGATSPVGARGIMQIMPATANKVGGKGAADQLNDPSYSLSLGQRYIAQLLDSLNGNLMKIGGAYNAGPGAVNRWVTTKAGKDDALLFVESIPVAETRNYVKNLMAYHWMYRRRFGQDAKSLDETARGQWPIYRPATPAAPVLPAAPATVSAGLSDVSFSKLGNNASGNTQGVQ